MRSTLHPTSLTALLASTVLLASTGRAQCTGDDSYEPNDTCTGAPYIATGFAGGLKVWGGGVDPDYYAVYLPAGKRCEFEAYYDPAVSPISLNAYDTAATGCPGVLVGTSNSASGTETLVIDNNTAGAWDLVVHVDGGPTGVCNAYGTLVTISSLGCNLNDDVFEDNDTCTTPVPLPLGLTTSLRLFGTLASTGKDSDWYSYTLQNGDKLVLDRTFVSGTGNLDLRVYDQGQTPCPVDQTADVIAGEPALGGGVLPAQVHNYTGGPMQVLVELDINEAGGSSPADCLTYNLSTAVSPSECLAEDGWEPNETCGTASPISTGPHTGFRARDGETDNYEFTVPPGAILEVDLFFSDSVSNLDLFLWDKFSNCGTGTSNALDFSRSTTDDEYLTWTNTTGGSLEVVIEARYAAPGSTYCVDYDMLIRMSGVTAGVPFCFGDGSDGVLCPCGNAPTLGSGEGCVNGTGLGAYLEEDGIPSASNDTLLLTVKQAVPGDFGIYVQNVASSTPTPFYNGAICLPTDSHLVRHYAPPTISPTITDALGTGVNAQPMTAGDFLGDTAPGVTIYYQFWGRDNAGPCGAGANFSAGMAVTWEP